jgi:hypothetical protein
MYFEPRSGADAELMASSASAEEAKPTAKQKRLS